MSLPARAGGLALITALRFESFSFSARLEKLHHTGSDWLSSVPAGQKPQSVTPT